MGNFFSFYVLVLILISLQAVSRQSVIADTITSKKKDTAVYFEDVSDLLNFNIYTLGKRFNVSGRKSK
jgi:hypothetical protein